MLDIVLNALLSSAYVAKIERKTVVNCLVEYKFVNFISWCLFFSAIKHFHTCSKHKIVYISNKVAQNDDINIFHQFKGYDKLNCALFCATFINSNK